MHGAGLKLVAARFPEPIAIAGVVELQRALRQLDGESQKQLRVIFNRAADIVATDASAKVPRGRTGRAQRSVKSRSGQRDARVVGGSKRVPYYPWLDFGGRVGRDGSVSRAFIRDGRYIYPSFHQARRQVMAELESGLEVLIVAVGLEDA